MPYIRRDSSGLIDSLHRHTDEAATEFLPDADPEVKAFLDLADSGAGTEHAAAEPAAFSRLDADFVRVIEDVIDTLIVRNILNITDLPAEAQAKLFARKSFRERVSRHSLRLFESADGNHII